MKVTPTPLMLALFNHDQLGLRILMVEAELRCTGKPHVL